MGAGDKTVGPSVSRRKVYWAAIAPLLSAVPVAAAGQTTDFSKQVTAVSGDWEAEGWKAGTIKLHPEMFTWQSDHYLLLLAEEPAMGRSAIQAASEHFDGDAVDDNVRNPMTVNMSGAREANPGLLASPYEWTDTYGDVNVSIYGVVTTAANTYIPYLLNCQRGDKSYAFEQCMRGGTAVLDALRGAGGTRLAMPQAEAPINIAAWRSSVSKDGRTIAKKDNYNSTVNAYLHVMPPRNIPRDQLASVLKAFSDSVIDGADNADKDSGTLIAVGSNEDPWLRREFPRANEGTSIQMAGTQATPDWRLALIGIRCPGTGWLKTCADAVEKAKFQIKSGQLDMRMKGYLASKEVPVPATGIQTSQVMGVYGRHLVNGIHPYFDGYLFFKDGTVYNNIDTPPQMIDVAQSKRENPKSWGRWRRTGSDLAITWGDGETDTIGTEPYVHLLGGNGSMRLSGSYGTISSSSTGMAGSGVVSRSAYTFYPDGTFVNARSSSYGVTGYAGGLTPTNIASGASSSSSGRARYVIDGYMITFHYPSGEVERETFGIFAKDANGNTPKKVQIGGTSYSLNLE